MSCAKSAAYSFAPASDRTFARIRYILPGVSPVTSYQYQVRAVNGPYVSPYSNIAGATTPDLPLVAPSNLAGTYNATTNKVTLTWRDNSSNEQGVALQMSYGGGTWFSDVTWLDSAQSKARL